MLDTMMFLTFAWKKMTSVSKRYDTMKVLPVGHFMETTVTQRVTQMKREEGKEKHKKYEDDDICPTVPISVVLERYYSLPRGSLGGTRRLLLGAMASSVCLACVHIVLSGREEVMKHDHMTVDMRAAGCGLWSFLFTGTVVVFIQHVENTD